MAKFVCCKRASYRPVCLKIGVNFKCNCQFPLEPPSPTPLSLVDILIKFYHYVLSERLVIPPPPKMTHLVEFLWHSDLYGLTFVELAAN